MSFWGALAELTAPVMEFMQYRIVFLDVDFSLWEFALGSAVVSIIFYAIFRIFE